MATGSLYGSSSESTGLYGIGAASGGTYFEWFIFYDSATAPATPTGGSWSFTTNTGTAPSGWLNAPPASPTNLVWVSIAVVDSRSTSTLTWSAPGLMTGSGLPILTGSGVPSSGTGLNGQLYVNTATTPQSMYLKEAGSWVQITGSNLVDLVNNQTIGGVKTFSSTIVGNISGTAGNVSGTVAIANGGTGGTTAAGARTNLGLGTISTQDASSVSITGGSITGITDLAVADGGTGASTAANARTNLGAVGLTDAQTLTNKTISGASNTLTNIGNSSLSNSTVTVNGSSIALGSSATVTASTPNNLVFGSQLSANASFNGSQQVNVNLLSVSTPGTYGTSNVVPVFTLNSYGQITSVSPQTITIDTTDISGTIGIGQGGTGANTVTAARVNLLPSYTGNGGKLLALNAGATDLEWKAVSGVGTVTSVDVSGGTTGLTTYGGPITAAGTVTLAGTLNVANGGTGVTTSTGSGSTVLSTSPSLTTPTQVSYEAWTGITAPTFTEGRMWYDSTAHSLSYYNDVSSAIVHIGQDLLVKVINNTGSTIANGSPVYITSTSSGQTYPNIALAKADAAATSAVIGLTNGAIANGAVGYVTAQGGIDGVNTSSFTVGQVLYLSPYSAGQLQNTIPPTGITVQVGVVSYVNASGKIYVKQTTPLAVPASIITGTLGTANGGTGLTSFTANGVVYASSTSALATGSALTFDGTSLGVKAATTEATNVNIGGGRSGSGFAYLDLIGDAAQAASYSARLIRGNGGANATTSLIHKGTGALEFTASDAGYLTYNINGSEQMRLTSTGLGIGTSSPAYKLDVSSSAVSGVIANFQATASNTYGTIQLTGNSRGGEVDFYNGATAQAAIVGNTGNLFFYTNGNSSLKATLDSSGNLGLGVTPSAWNTSYKALEIGALGNSLIGFGASDVAISSGGYLSSSGWKYSATNSLGASFYEQYTGQHIWYNKAAVSHTAGDPITFIQAMTLDASGNLMVGTTSPAGGAAKFNVYGTQTYDSANATIANWYSGGTQIGYIGQGNYAVSGASSTGISFASQSSMSFATGGQTERARIDSSGNLGLGVTPSGTTRFQVLSSGNNLAYFQDSSAAGVQYAVNTNGSGQVKHFATWANSGIDAYHAWFVTTSGGAQPQAMTLDASGNLGVGITSPAFKFDVNSAVTGTYNSTTQQVVARLYNSPANLGSGVNSAFLSFQTTTDGGGSNPVARIGVVAESYGTNNGAFVVATRDGSGITERARIDSSGNLLVGTTSAASASKLDVLSSSSGVAGIGSKITGSSSTQCFVAWNALTTGNNIFQEFYTETSATLRGSITYNRAGGLVAYNVTSDYRAKDISGPVTNSGALIDSIPVYMGTMKGATQERPMFIAHEVPAYAHTGEKDAVDADGKPVYQQMDASALIPVMWAEIQSLRTRLAALEAK